MHEQRTRLDIARELLSVHSDLDFHSDSPFKSRSANAVCIREKQVTYSARFGANPMYRNISTVDAG
jgi:hypothetical protein